MNLFRNTIYISRIIADINTILFSFLIANFICIPRWEFSFDANHSLLLGFSMIAWLIISRYIDLYDEFRSRYIGHEILAVIKAVILQGLAVIVVVFLFNRLELSRGFLLTYLLVLLPTLVLEKYIVRESLKELRRKGRNIRNMLIIGAGELGLDFFESVYDNPHFGYNVIGFLDDEKERVSDITCLGEIDDLDKILAKTKVEDVVIALPNNASNKVRDIVKICEDNATRVKILPDYFSYLPGSYNVSMFDRFPVISIRDSKLYHLRYRALKRIFDIVFTSFLFLLVFSWLWPFIAVLIKVSSKGPVFYKQERWGRNNKRFLAYKFRSMQFEGNNSKFKQVTQNDPRITKIGAILRKTNLDELPQFFNVLKGDMSIVGPRPHPTDLNIESKQEVDRYMVRHLVKGGITGWAQVNGYRGETGKTILMQKRVEHDIWYIERWSFVLDLNIIFLTLWNMVKGDPAAY